jgi:hypothetical protein
LNALRTRPQRGINADEKYSKFESRHELGSRGEHCTSLRIVVSLPFRDVLKLLQDT